MVDDEDESGWVAFGTLDDIPRGGARAVKTMIGEIGLFRTADDRVFALDNLCPHKGARLSMGMIEGEVVVCPWHGWSFALADGRAATDGFGRTCPVPVRVIDGRVLLRLVPPPW
jgi:nitrite reductase (NADH) small subunit